MDRPAASAADSAILPTKTALVDRKTGTAFGWYSSTSMTNNRIDILRGMVASNPSDTFARYGLAMEYVKGGQLEQAIDEFDHLLLNNPNYPAAYFHAGQTLEKLGRIDDARGMYQKGIEITTEMGDQHTRSELQAALDIL
jgi:Tfp pilus assembly protein PilF